MPTILFRSIVYLVLAASLFVTVHAQAVQEPSGRILEIQSSRKPGYIELFRERVSGFWAGGFPRLKDWKLPSTGDPVLALDFKARLVGDKCELTISQLSGKRMIGNIDVIARVVVAEGEEVVVSELKRFGFEPVTVKMVTTSPVAADVPLVMNPAPQLRTTVSSIIATVPTFKIKFQNDSPKDIMAIGWRTEANGGALIIATAHDKYGRALIDANGVYEMKVNAEKYTNDSSPLVFVIGSVIYRDGTVDGDPKPVAQFLALTEGRKKAVEEITPLLQKASEQNTGRIDLKSLISAVNSLDDNLPMVNGRPATTVGVNFSGVISETISSLRQMEADFAGKSDAELASTLRDLAKFYGDWLVRNKQ